MRSLNTPPGLFSPISNSLRTTVISLSRSDLRTWELTIRSASMPSAQSRLSPVAGSVSKYVRAARPRPRRGRGDRGDAQAVGEPVLGDAFDRNDLGRGFGRAGRGGE